MPSADYNRFIASMTIGFDQWHDGTGYDLDALRELNGDERAQVERVLIDHLRFPGNWRDIESLNVLGTPGARSAIQNAATEHRLPEVRRLAGEIINPPPPPTAAETEAFAAKCVTDGDLSCVLRINTPVVRRAVLDRARHALPKARTDAATMLLSLQGEVDDELVARFASEDTKEWRAAWGELRRRTGL